MKDKVDIDEKRLFKLWKTYINDSSLFTKESFGKYVHTRVMKPGWCWPKLYYAQSGSYDMLWKLIHKDEAEGIRRVL